MPTRLSDDPLHSSGLNFTIRDPLSLPTLQYLAINLLFLPLFLWAYFPLGAWPTLTTTGPGPNALLPVNLWGVQLCIHIPVLLANLAIVMKLPKGPAMY